LNLTRFNFLSLLILFFNCQSVQSQTNTVIPCSLKIDSVSTHQIVSPMMSGFSCENIFLEINNPLDTALLNQLKKLNPAVLRFPGGMLSNFYHPMNNGYGLKKSEIAPINVQYAQQLQLEGVFTKQAAFNHPYLHDFVNFCHALKSKVLVTANILTGTPEELIDELNYFTDNNVEIAGVELGDELYLGIYRQVFPYPGSYLSKTQMFVQMVHKYFPKIKVGMVAAPLARISDLEGTSAADFGYFKSWNDALSKTDLFDAIVIHAYTPVTVLESQPTDSIFRRAASDAEKTFGRNGTMVQAMDYYAEVFPKSPIWISEWNLSLRPNKSYFVNTVLQTIYIGSFLNFLNELNSESSPHVDMAMFQSIATGGVYNHYGAIDYRSEKEKSSTNIVRRTPWYAFKLMTPVFDGRNHVCVSNTPCEIPINFYSYVDTTNSQWLICFMNYSGKEIKIDSLINDSTDWSGKQVSIEYIKGALQNSYGWTRFSRNNYNTAPEAKNETMLLKDFIFPSYGVGIIRIKK